METHLEKAGDVDALRNGFDGRLQRTALGVLFRE